MDRGRAGQQIRETGVIAIIRTSRPENLVGAVEAMRAGGLGVIEVTLNTPGALDTIADVKKRFGDDILFGAGTVLDPESARRAIHAGADFVVSPTLNADTIQVCQKNERVAVPGCFTPTEILTAWEKGADFVKVFPAEVGGPSYIRAVRAPLPEIPLVPTGGVNLETIGAYIKAGAAAAAVGSCLVSQEILDKKAFKVLTERARELCEAVAAARQE